MAIKFYATKNAWGEFSNFFAAPFELDGRIWPTSEHYFQAKKFIDLDYQEKIRTVESPMIAARLGRSRQVPIRSDWEQIKDEIMLAAVRAKFAAHSRLQELLLSTEYEFLIEDSPTDFYWGCGADGSGKNRLGQILVQVREELRDRKTSTSTASDAESNSGKR